MQNRPYLLRRRFTRQAPKGVPPDRLQIYEDFNGQGGAIVARVSALGDLTEPYADLLTAAPDMLAALYWLRDYQEACLPPEREPGCPHYEAFDRITAAIAKAQGHAD